MSIVIIIQPGQLIHVCITLLALEGSGVCKCIVYVRMCPPSEASLATLASICCQLIEKSHYLGDQDEIPCSPVSAFYLGYVESFSAQETVLLITSWLHVFLYFQVKKNGHY